MHNGQPSVIREIGAAIAVLSLYLLTLLVPLHQSAASQRDFAELGYRTIGALSICTAINDAESGQDAPSVVQCAVAAMAKTQLVLPMPVPVVQSDDAVEGVQYAAFAARAPPPLPVLSSHRPRAPPVTV